MLTGRSLLGALFFLSHNVDPPDSHKSRGLVTVLKGRENKDFNWSIVPGKFLGVAATWGVRPDPLPRPLVLYRRCGFELQGDVQSADLPPVSPVRWQRRDRRHAHGAGWPIECASIMRSLSFGELLAVVYFR